MMSDQYNSSSNRSTKVCNNISLIYHGYFSLTCLPIAFGNAKVLNMFEGIKHQQEESEKPKL